MYLLTPAVIRMYIVHCTILRHDTILHVQLTCTTAVVHVLVAVVQVAVKVNRIIGSRGTFDLYNCSISALVESRTCRSMVSVALRD